MLSVNTLRFSSMLYSVLVTGKESRPICRRWMRFQNTFVFSIDNTFGVVKSAINLWQMNRISQLLGCFQSQWRAPASMPCIRQRFVAGGIQCQLQLTHTLQSRPHTLQVIEVDLEWRQLQFKVDNLRADYGKVIAQNNHDSCAAIFGPRSNLP